MTEVHMATDGRNTVLLVVAVYLSYDATEPPPTAEMRWLADHAEKQGKHLTFGCDVNAHHTAWGSSNINRGEYLMA